MPVIINKNKQLNGSTNKERFALKNPAEIQSKNTNSNCCELSFNKLKNNTADNAKEVATASDPTVEARLLLRLFPLSERIKKPINGNNKMNGIRVCMLTTLIC